MNSEEDDYIETNSSESSPPRETHLPITTTTTTTTTTITSAEPSLPELNKFDKLFERFIEASTVKNITRSFRDITNTLDINTNDVFENGYTPKPSVYKPQKFSLNNTYHNYHLQQEQIREEQALSNTRLIYQIIKSKTNYWKANNLWKFYDKLAMLKEYKRSENARNLTVLIIGSGPVGLRLAIECALLGLKCHVVEKRDRFSRNNVLHLWPYTIVDLKNLGAKMFYGKFCAGAIDHISIRKLQCILLKVALLFGVQVHFNTSFEEVVEPTSNENGWHVKVLPENHVLTSKCFDVVIGADGRRNTLPGFNRKEFRGKLAIGITANFLNYKTTQEAGVQEQSGVNYIYNQKFFNDLRNETNIDLENIVYYKDDTHYFVMTAKRQSLIDKGVILQDFPDASQLLAKNNVNFEALCDYAKLAAYVSTNRKLNVLNFAKNHYGQADVAMFDFTSLFQAENASRVIERHDRKLFMSLVGDSLLEPFWPTGTGIARGFLAVLDTAWAIKHFAENRNPLEILCERESIYQLLSQTMPENLSQKYQEYTIDPTTRYVNLNWNMKMFNRNQVKHLFDNGTKPLASIENSIKMTKKIKSDVHSQTLLRWCQIVVQPYGLRIENFTTAWKDGMAFCAIINRFRPDIIDYSQLNELNSDQNISLLFQVMESHLLLGTVPNTNEYISNGVTTRTTVLMILDKLYSIFKNDPLNDVENNYDEEDLIEDSDSQSNHKRKHYQDEAVVMRKNRPRDEFTFKIDDLDDDKFNPNKRNSLKHISVNGIAKILKSKLEQQSGLNVSQENNRPKSVQPIMLRDSPKPNLTGYVERKNSSSKYLVPSLCYQCKDAVSIMERQNVMHLVIHTTCFTCDQCKRKLDSASYEHVQDPITRKYTFYCINHKPSTKDRLTTTQNYFNRTSYKHEPSMEIDLRYTDDKYNAFELKKPVSSSESTSPSPSPPARNLSRRSKFFAEAAKPVSVETPERAEFDAKLSDPEDDDDYDDYEDSDEYSHSNENEETDESELSDNLEQNEPKIKEPVLEINESPVIKNNARVLPRPLSCVYNYNSYGQTSILPLDSPISLNSKESVISTSTQSVGSIGSSTSKLKKFNVNSPAIAESRALEDEINMKRKQEQIRLENETEKEKNRLIIRDLITARANNLSNNSLTVNTNNKPVTPLGTSSPKSLGMLRKTFLCQFCNKSASITERVRLHGLVYHRECIKCCKCGSLVKNYDNFSKATDDDKCKFYCNRHASCKSDNVSICSIDFETPETTVNVTNPEQSKILLDCSLIRQRALEKARLKSDEELGLKTKNDFSFTFKSPESLCCKKGAHELIPRKLEFVDNREINQSRINESKTESDSDDDLFIDDENNIMKKLILNEFDTEYSINNKKRESSPAPLAKSETFEAIEEEKLRQNASKRQGFKNKLTKLLAPSVLSPQMQMSSLAPVSVITTSPSVNLTPKKVSPKITASSSGILKSIFSSKSPRNYDPASFKAEFIKKPDNVISPVPPIRKKLIPEPSLSLSNSSRTNSTDSSETSSTSSLENSFDNNESNDVDKTSYSANSFNALNIAHSPRLSRNCRRAKLNHKRQQNEEKRIEKQRKDQRLRTTQDLQRKLDELHTRSVELEQEGNRLEVIISNCDNKKHKISSDQKKSKLEQELYNIIHQRNLLARCDSKLNIQMRAINIENKLSECQQCLRDTMNIPETEKTEIQMVTERSMMEKIVELIEEKNQLVEQLESLRLLERDEDSEIIKIFSSNFYSLNTGQSNEIMSKFEPYADII